MKHRKFHISILFILPIIISVFLLTGCGSSGSTLFTRAATNNDIHADLSEKISFNIEYKITPYTDIENLQVTLKFYNNNKELMTTKIKNIGDVKRNVQYSVPVSLTEFSFFDLFKITYTTIDVTKGNVSYFQ